MLYFQSENCCKQETKPNWIPKERHNPKKGETEKKIVNSLRLLHEAFLYFEIGSNQVANNDNNFCNKIKHEANPHEFNNFATSRTFFIYNSLFSFLYYAHTYIQIRITQPTDFLPSNYINFYVRQLTSKKCLRFKSNKSRNFTHNTQSGTLRYQIAKNNLQKYSKQISNKPKTTSIQQITPKIDEKCQTILIRTIFIYFISQTGMV